MNMASVWTGNRGTIGPAAGFNPLRDAEAVWKAIKGIGTNEKTLIDILASRSNAQRQMLAAEFKKVSGTDLKEALKGDLSGNFEHVMVALVTPPAVSDAKQMKKTMEGLGTNEEILIEILASRSNKQMKEVAQEYYTRKDISDRANLSTAVRHINTLTLSAGMRRPG